MTIAESVYRNYLPAGQGVGVLPLVENATVLEIGFGSGDLLRKLSACNNKVYGTDVSETPLPFADDFFDAVYCYEVFEHLTNPHRMFYEIRRVLKAGCSLFFSVPSQEYSMGYGPSRHTFVYPGLLERHNLERFFMQMYFKIEEFRENADGIIHHRNYRLTNQKQLALPDVMEIIIGDYSVVTLYGTLLNEQTLEQEIERETEPYFALLGNAAQTENWSAFDSISDLILQFYPDNFNLLLKIAEAALHGGNRLKAKQILNNILTMAGITDDLATEIKTTITYL